MHGLIEMICAIVASLAAAVFAQFGVTLHAHPVERPPVQDVRRTAAASAGPADNSAAVCRPSAVCRGATHRRS